MGLLSKSAMKTFVAAIAVFVISVSAAVLMWLHLINQGTMYHEQLTLAANLNERDLSTQAFLDIVAETKEQRASIESAFLDVVDIAVFLEQVEQYAKQNELLLQSDQLQELSTENVASDYISQVRIPFRLEGTRTAALDFVRLLELVPYHGYVERFQIQSSASSPGQVTATVVMVLSYKQYDRDS